MNKVFKIADRFSVQVYEETEALLTLREAWDRCAGKNGSYFPFLCYDWFVTWLRHFPETQLHVAVLYEHEDVAAIMPMMWRIVYKKGVPFKSYTFAGNAYSQAKAILHNTTDPDTRVMQAEWLFRYFMHHAPSWDFLDIYGLQPENDNCDQITRAAFRCGLRCRKTVAYANWYQNNVALSAEEYIRARPGKVRKNAPYYYRKIQREGNTQFRLITAAENLDATMDSYYRLYAKSWKRSEDIGPNFHRDLAKMAANNGWLRLGFLDFNASPIACQLWLVQGGTAYFVKTFYDEAYKAFSPGTVLNALMLRAVLERDKVTSIDYLQGDQPFKQDWVDNRRERLHLVMYNATMKGRILCFLNRLADLRSKIQ